jgi:hypothetical protein
VSPPNDTTHTLAVDLTSSGGSLVGGSASDLAALVTLSVVENEFVGFQNAALTSAFHYNLTTLLRGLFGSTIPASHAIGASYVRCDSALLRMPFPQGVDGQVVYFKFPAFNVFGLGLEDIAGVSAIAHTIGKNSVTSGAGGDRAPAPSLSVSAAEVDETGVTVHVACDAGTTPAAAVTYELTKKVGKNAPVSLSTGNISALPLDIFVVRDPRRAVIVELTISDPLFPAKTILASLTISQDGRDGAHSTGLATGSVSDDDSRSGMGGLPVPKARIHTLPQYNDLGDTPLIDPATKRLQIAMLGPTGIGMDVVERGGNKGDNALDSGFVVVPAGIDLARGYLGKHLGNIPDDATSDRRSATANEKTGGSRGFSSIDSGNVVITTAIDFGRGYTNKHMGNIPDDATSDRRAATLTEKTGGSRGFTALDGSAKLQTGVTAAATGTDGYVGIESRRGAARQAGHASQGLALESLHRGGLSGVPTSDALYARLPVYDATGTQVLIDPHDTGALSALRSLGTTKDRGKVTKSGQVIPNNTLTSMAFSTTEFDVGVGVVDLGFTPNRLVIPTDANGLWLVHIATKWASNAAGYRGTRIQASLATVLQTKTWAYVNAVNGIQTGYDAWTLVNNPVAGDYFWCDVEQNSGGNLSVDVQMELIRLW